MPWMIPAAIGVASFAGGERANSSRTDMAREQMAFQREMSNTAHQRQMADLKAAGVNPMLTAKYGGASSPGGAMPQIQDTITPAVNTGLQVRQTQNLVKKTNQEVFNLIKQFDVLGAQGWVLEAEKYLKDKTTDEKIQNIRLMKETIEVQKKKAQISEIQFNLLNEAIKQLTNAFEGLNFLNN